MKIESFDYFYNKDKDKKCLILGGAPSIRNIDYKNFDGIIISMGDVPIRLQDECNIDYWINANSEFPIPDVDYEEINKFENATLLFAHSVVRGLDYNVIRKKLKINWFEFDQRHFEGRSCNDQFDYRFDLKESQECCSHIGDTTIQEFLQNKYKTTSHYSTASTVAIHALALAIILGCKTIYIGGVEIPIYDKDYVHYKTNSIKGLLKEIRKYGLTKGRIKQIVNFLFKFKTKSFFYPDVPVILQDFEYLNNICRNNNISLYNLSKNSNLKKISNFKTLDPNKINSE